MGNCAVIGKTLVVLLTAEKLGSGSILRPSLSVGQDTNFRFRCSTADSKSMCSFSVRCGEMHPIMLAERSPPWIIWWRPPNDQYYFFECTRRNLQWRSLRTVQGGRRDSQTGLEPRKSTMKVVSINFKLTTDPAHYRQNGGPLPTLVDVLRQHFNFVASTVMSVWCGQNRKIPWKKECEPLTLGPGVLGETSLWVASTHDRSWHRSRSKRICAVSSFS